MYFKLIITAFIAISIGCKKDKEELVIQPQPKSVAELLTQKTWKLVSHGVDHNNNNTIDADEDLTRDCEKDNLYIYKEDGNALFLDNILICGDGITEFPFIWKLIDNNTALDFTYSISKIQKLNEDEMSIYHEAPLNGQIKKFFVVFRH